MPPCILLHDVSKRYHLGETQHTMLRDAFVGAFSKLVGRKNHTPPRPVVWALNGVSLEVQRGEVIGLIGPNGAGKSTLLKVLSRITYPTSGRVEVHGRVGSLLEVGTGFHDELTGRENIYLNGSILGMRKREIDSLLEQIVEFADIGGFLDTPIKRYSSGMRMRLGFAVAAHLSTDLLFVDEVLAVGDAAFQKKCMGAMRQLGDGGRTVVFVSHNMAAVQNLCTRTIWIAHGRVMQDGDTPEVIRAYLNSFDAAGQGKLDLAAIPRHRGTGEVRLLQLEFLLEDGGTEPRIHSGGALHVRLYYECYRDVPNLHFGFRIYSQLGVLLSTAHTWSTDQAIPLAPKGRASIDLEIGSLNLMPGTYCVGIDVASMHEYHDVLENVVKIDVEPSNYYGTGRGIEARLGLVFFPFRWRVPENTLSGSRRSVGAGDGAASGSLSSMQTVGTWAPTGSSR